MSKKTYLILIMVAGIVCALLFSFGIASIENYYVTWPGKDILFFLMHVALGFLLGAYVGAVLPWVFTKEKEFFMPVGVLRGIIKGFLLAGIVGVISSFILLPFLGSAVFVILAILSVLSFTNVECNKKAQISYTFRKRLMLGAIGLVAIILFLLVSVRGITFPHKAPVQVRHAWATTHFKHYYSFAVDYVKNSSAINNDVGAIIGIAPAPHSKNKVMTNSRMFPTADFTLDVKGTSGSGLCNVGVCEDEESSAGQLEICRCIWEFNGLKWPLVSRFQFNNNKDVESFIGTVKNLDVSDAAIKDVASTDGLIDIDKLKVLAKDEFENLRRLGLEFVEQGKYRQAVEQFTQAIHLDPKGEFDFFGYSAYPERAQAYELLGEYQKAIDDLNKAIDLLKVSSYEKALLKRKAKLINLLAQSEE